MSGPGLASPKVGRTGAAGALRAGLAAAVLLLSLSSCSFLVNYTDRLVDPGTGRTPVVTWPARFGWGLGFVVGLPLDLAGAPVSYAVYKAGDSQDPGYLFYFLFPSLVTSQVGTLILGAPFDFLEFVTYRWWSGGEGGGEEEKKASPPSKGGAAGKGAGH